MFYYDYMGRTIQVRERDLDGWTGTFSTRYNFGGHVTGTLESHTSPAGEAHTVRTELILDNRGNVLSEEIYADGVQISHTDYAYDELMRPVGRATGAVTETTSYDIRGWQTSRTADRGQDRIYSEALSYMNPASAGNRLAGVVNTESEDTGTFSYTYDSSGNLTTDSHNRLQIQNNVLNLPMQVEQSTTGTSAGTMDGTMTYTYLGDGTRVAARAVADAPGLAGKRYRGSFVYDVSADGAQRLESIAVSTGRLIALIGTNGAISFESDGFITDHLGNVAAVVNLSASPATSTENAILEQNEYTPFGTRLTPALKTQAANRWRYAGKEEQDIAGMDLHLLDFGARYYDSFTCRWNAVDPLTHKYFSMSPYSYCGNDPVNRFDPDGEDWYKNNDSGELVWFAGNGNQNGYSNLGQTYWDENDYYSLFGAKISTTAEGGNLAKVYEAIDKAIISSYTDQKEMQYSWDTEDKAISMISINIETKGFKFIYSGKNFNSDIAECAPNSTSYSRVTGSITGHKKLIVENMLSGPKPLMGSIVADKWHQSPNQYPSIYWITLSGAEKSGRMIMVGFSKANKDQLDTLINSQLKNRKQ